MSEKKKLEKIRDVVSSMEEMSEYYKEDMEEGFENNRSSSYIHFLDGKEDEVTNWAHQLRSILEEAGSDAE